MTAMAKVENLQYKITVSLIADRTMPFNSSPNIVRESKHLCPYFK